MFRYDYLTAKVKANPFNSNCMEAVDWVIVITAGLSCAIFLLDALFFKFAKTAENIAEKELTIRTNLLIPLMDIIHSVSAIG